MKNTENSIEEPKTHRYSTVKVTSLLFGTNENGTLAVLAIKKYYNPKKSKFKKDRIPSSHWKAPKGRLTSDNPSPKETQREVLSRLLGMNDKDYRFDLLVCDEVVLEKKNGTQEWVRNLVFAGELIGTPKPNKNETSKLAMLTKGEVRRRFSDTNQYKAYMEKGFEMWEAHLKRPQIRVHPLDIFRKIGKGAGSSSPAELTR